MSYLELHEKQLSEVAARDSNKGRIFKRCLDKQLSHSDIESLVHINSLSALSYKNVERILDVLER